MKLAMLEDDGSLPQRIVSSDEVNFYLSGKVNMYNIQIWRFQNPYVIIQIEHDSHKVRMFHAVFGEECQGIKVTTS